MIKKIILLCQWRLSCKILNKLLGYLPIVCLLFPSLNWTTDLWSLTFVFYVKIKFIFLEIEIKYINNFFASRNQPHKQLRIFFQWKVLRKLKSVNTSGWSYMAGIVKLHFPIRLLSHQRQDSYHKRLNTNWSLDGISKSSLIQEVLIECQPEFSSVECRDISL